MLELEQETKLFLLESPGPITPGERTPGSRGIKDTLPGRFSWVRNVVIPMGSVRTSPSKRHSISKPTARKAEFLSGDGMIQEANAAGRKATGNHNRADRASWPGRKAADVDRVNHPGKAGKGCEVVGEVRCAPLAWASGSANGPRRPLAGVFKLPVWF
jgi:hypothetical protein